MSVKKCPTQAELSTYVRGLLPVSQADQLTAHVADCPRCEDTINELSSATSDSLIGRIQAPAAPQPYVDEEACLKVTEAIKKQVVHPDEKSAAARQGSAPLPSTPTRAMNRNEFVETLTTFGFVSGGDLAAIEKQLSSAEAGNVQALARALVQQGKLTKYQASAVYQGQSKSLVYGDYLVLDRIGAGGMGQVYKARHKRMDRIVALKVLSTAAMKNADSIRRFEREVRAAAKLNHPNIVTAHDAGLQEGVHYLVMEYVEGPDLSSLLKKQGKFPIKQACEFITQAARGFAFAHEKGIVHRDIKPGNLLLDKSGIVKVLDMGLARFDDGSLGETMGEAELTQSGAVMGTVDYMAPEQALNTSKADAKSDVYGLGCTLYRLLTGESVFGGDTIVEKILAHREQPIPQLRHVRPDAPPALESLINRMIAKKPDDRPTMKDIADTLPGTLEPGIAVQPAVVRAHAGAPAGVAAVAAAPPKTKGTVPPKKGSNLPLLVAAGAGGLLILGGIIFIIRDKDGNKVAEVNAPDGSSVTAQATPPTPSQPTTKAAPIAAAVPSATAPISSFTTPPVAAPEAPSVATTPATLPLPTASPTTMPNNPGAAPVAASNVPLPPLPTPNSAVVTSAATSNRSSPTEILAFDFDPLAQEVAVGRNLTMEFRVTNSKSQEYPLTGTYHHSDLATFKPVAAVQVRLQCLEPGPEALLAATDYKNAPMTAAGIIVGAPRISSTNKTLAGGETVKASMPLRISTLPAGRYAMTVTCVPTHGLGRIQYASYEFRLADQPAATPAPGKVAWSFTPPTVLASASRLLPITDPERRAVLWALPLGAKLQIMVNGQGVGPNPLPDGPFTVRNIDFFENANNNESRNMITDADLENLVGLKEIKQLRLNYGQITDFGLKHLAGLATVTELNLSDTKIGDSCIAKLAALKEIRALRLNRTQIGDAGLEKIVAQFPMVNEPLELNETKVTDAGVAHLRNAQYVRFLGLAGTEVTDECIPHLAAMPRLGAVSLIGTRVTEAGVAKLRATAVNKNLEIGFDPAKVKTGPRTTPIIAVPFASTTPTTPAATPAAAPSDASPNETPVAAGPSRLIVPDSKAQQTALQLVKEVFKDDYAAARVPDKKAELAEKLLEQSTQTTVATDRYVLLNEARTFALDGDDQALLRRVLTAIVTEFDVDTATVHIDSWKGVLAKSRPTTVVKVIYDDVAAMFESAVAQGAFDEAKRFGDYALTIAPRIGDATAVKSTRDRNALLASRQQEWNAAKIALTTLAASPDDAEANLTVGRYRALVEQDWANAFTNLAKSSDETWKALAAKSVAVAADGAARAALADEFWDASTKSKGPGRAELAAAALYWYQASLPSLSGLQKVRIEKRIAEATAAVPTSKLPSTPLGVGESISTATAVPSLPSPTASVAPAASPAGNTAPPANSEAPRRLPAGFRLPPGAVSGLIGRMTLTQNGQESDSGILFTYAPGTVFQHETVAPLLGPNGPAIITAKGINIQLAGVLHVPSNMEVAVWHAGGSASGGNVFLYVDGKEISIVGDDKGKNDAYRLPLTKGAHAIGWKFRGGTLGNSLVHFMDGKSGEPLTVYATADIVRAARSVPTRQQVDNSADQKLPPRPPSLPPSSGAGS